MDIVIPNLGDIDEVEVIEICVSAGEDVVENDVILVIESDKASMEIPSPAAGTITSIQVALGDQVKEGDVIAELDSDAPNADSESDKGAEKGAETGAETSADSDTGEPEDEEATASDTVESTSEQQPSTETETEIEVLVPDLGDASEVVVIEVAVKAGDVLEINDLLVVLESDKASMEIAAEQAGTVVRVGVEEGQDVEQGTLIATLSVAGETQTPSKESTSEPAASTPAPQKQTTAPQSSDELDQRADSGADNARDEAAAKVYAGPAVRRLARELGVVLSEVPGTGNRNRITKEDVKAYVKQAITGGKSASQSSQGAGWPTVPQVDFAKFGPIELQPLHRIQQRGADNLHRSWVNLPHVTQHDDADITDLEEFRQSLKAEGEQKGIKVTPLAFLVKACCKALNENPLLNSSLHADGKQLVMKSYLNIGMAVDTPEGLVVPVIKAADSKSIWELSEEVATLSEKARTKKLAMDDLQGGTFTISSLGALGGTGFTPIVNAPEVAILGVSNMQTRPMWDGTAFVPRKVLPLSLSYDHRVVNGADGGRFMVSLTKLLTDIRRLAL